MKMKKTSKSPINVVSKSNFFNYHTYQNQKMKKSHKMSKLTMPFFFYNLTTKM
jgi:hypothetical protein